MIFDRPALQALRDYINEPPPTAVPFNMDTWFALNVERAATGDYSCGTSACLAGHAVTLLDTEWKEAWALALDDPKNYATVDESDREVYCFGGLDPEDSEQRATGLLGMSGKDTYSLFRACYWPAELRGAYVVAGSDEERRAAAVRLLDSILDGSFDEWREPS
jgi:hypothetical protein